MKVALVVHDVGKKGGHDRYVAELAGALAARHEVHVFACTCEDIDRSRIRFHRVPAVKWPDLLKMISFLVSATWMLRNRDFDIIHTQGGCTLVQDVATAHICQATWQEVYPELDHTDVSRLRQWYHRFVAFLMGPLEQYLYARSRHVIALSNQVKHDLIRCYGISADTITTVYNGINLEEFHPDNIPAYRDETRERLGISPQTFVLFFVGDFKRKGLRYAIEALAHLPEPGRVRLMVAGGGVIQPYEEQAARLGVADSVCFVGQQAEVNRYYATSDALVFPTLYEPFGFVITEAMATGIPVITSVGASEIIRDGEDGLLLQNPRDAREIATQIQRLRMDPDLCERIGRNGRACVESLSWQSFADRIEQIYTDKVRKMDHEPV